MEVNFNDIVGRFVDWKVTNKNDRRGLSLYERKLLLERCIKEFGSNLKVDVDVPFDFMAKCRKEGKTLDETAYLWFKEHN